MIEEIEKKINDILSRDISIMSKRLAVKNIIEELPERHRKAFLNAFNNYKWPVKENDVFPEFKLNNFERSRTNQPKGASKWAIDLYDKGSFFRSMELIRYSKSMVYERNLPTDVNIEVQNAIYGEKEYNGRMINRNEDLYRDFTYSVDHNPGKSLDVSIIEKRRYNRTGEVATYINKYSTKYDHGNYVTEATSSLDEKHPEVLHNKTIYINGKEISTEWCTEEKTKEPYTEEDIAFLNSLGTVDSKTYIFQRSLRENMSYSSNRKGDFYFAFSFGKRKEDADYVFTVAAGDFKAYVSGTKDKANIKAFLTANNRHDEIPYDDFIDYASYEAVEKVTEITDDLKELGVTINYLYSDSLGTK